MTKTEQQLLEVLARAELDDKPQLPRNCLHCASALATQSVFLFGFFWRLAAVAGRIDCDCANKYKRDQTCVKMFSLFFKKNCLISKK